MTTLHLGCIAHCVANPFYEDNAVAIIENGALAVDEAGKIVAVGDAASLRKAHPVAHVQNHGDAWLLPGMIDGHSHFPQLDVTAAPGGDQLLEWLTESVFPAEMRFREAAFAKQAAEDYTKTLLRNGTTCAMVFGSQFSTATRALFQAASRNGLRLASGITLMDRGEQTPTELFTPADEVYEKNLTLIKEVSDDPMLHYVITPRFALSCSPETMDVCKTLVDEFPELRVQTHINENLNEIETTKELHPGTEHYLDVYDRHGIVGERTVFAHNIHPTDEELDLMADRGCAVCHCPGSNKYLGSGLFPMARHIQKNIPLLMGTDIGAGTTFSIMEELGVTYGVQQLVGNPIGGSHLLYLGTLGGAKALHLDHEIGNFAAGKDADFLVIDPSLDGYLPRRLKASRSLEEQLFVLLVIGRAHMIRKTHTRGEIVYEK